ncbi:MAG: prepilin-type N-terminal cleavage/methylation domain-containing protein [Streptococcaceae bacterium]|jgi:type II secretory pathway pseudopilin PulG|nr:prepilin-type N-terminal cleavage/methylation domain-containing protein [Streptococcaceae bacterium]
MKRKKLAGFTLLELLIALLITLPIICFTISGLTKYRQYLEWQRFLYSFEKSMMSWQEKAVSSNQAVRIQFIPEKNCFKAFFLTKKVEMGNCQLPKEIKYTAEGKQLLQFNEQGHFSYLFKIHFCNLAIHKYQSYSLLIGGRLWKNHEKY